MKRLLSLLLFTSLLGCPLVAKAEERKISSNVIVDNGGNEIKNEQKKTYPRSKICKELLGENYTGSSEQDKRLEREIKARYSLSELLGETWLY